MLMCLFFIVHKCDLQVEYGQNKINMYIKK